MSDRRRDHVDSEAGTSDPGAERSEFDATSAELPNASEGAWEGIDGVETPKRIGSYTIESVIGEGGMGAVFRARQQNPDREVALKVIRRETTSPSILRRFELEAQLLGRLQHAGVAQIYEAGTFESRRGPQPYFAMELVRGLPLDVYARERRLDARARLTLFTKIAAAVHHAHQKGIIHRDLKPGNILVTPAGQPKVLDFGVARVTDSDIQAVTIQTDVGQLVGTLPYMSPEQALGDPDQIDVRSDVYALGVVLYELLTGRLPYDLKKRMVHEAARIIREDDPTPLSSIDRGLRGDVETIVARALEKEKERRYQSVAEMDADVRRFLEDKPIVARPPTAAYQLRKFARRNKGLVTGAATVLLALIAGTVVSSAQAIRASRAEDRATERLAEAEATAGFLNDMLAAVEPGAMGKDVTVRTVLDESAAGVDEEFAERPIVAARVHATIGQSYLGLGLFEEAESHLRRSFDLRREALGPEDPATLEVRGEWALSVFRTGDVESAERELARFLEDAAAALGPDHPTAIAAKNRLAELLMFVGRFEEAERLLAESIEAADRSGIADTPDGIAARYMLAGVYADTNRMDEAERLYLEGIDACERVFGPEHPHTLNLRSNYALMLQQTARYEQAASIGRELLEIRSRVLGEEHADTLTSMNNLALSLSGLGRRGEATDLMERSFAIGARVLGAEHPETLISMNNLASFFIRQDQFEKAAPIAARSVDLHRKTLGDSYYGTGFTLATHGRALIGLERFAEAEESLLEAIEIIVEAFGADHPASHRTYEMLANLYDAWGKPEQAAAWRARMPEQPDPDPEEGGANAEQEAGGSTG